MGDHFFKHSMIDSKIVNCCGNSYQIVLMAMFFKHLAFKKLILLCHRPQWCKLMMLWLAVQVDQPSSPPPSPQCEREYCITTCCLVVFTQPHLSHACARQWICTCLTDWGLYESYCPSLGEEGAWLLADVFREPRVLLNQEFLAAWTSVISTPFWCSSSWAGEKQLIF